MYLPNVRGEDLIFPAETGPPTAIEVSRRGGLALKLLSGAEDATWCGEDRLLAQAHRDAMSSAVETCMKALESGLLPGPKKTSCPVTGELSSPLLLAIKRGVGGIRV